MFQRIHKHLEVDLNCLHSKIPHYLEILSVSNEERTPTSIYISPQCLLPKVRVTSWVLSLFISAVQMLILYISQEEIRYDSPPFK